MNSRTNRDQDPHPMSSRLASSSNSAPKQPPVISDRSAATNIWWHPQGGPATEGKKFEQPSSQLPTPSGSTMIGPTSSFYSPDDSAQAQYQQWLDAIESQPQHALSQIPMSSSYGPESLHGPRPHQNPSIFDFPPGHYPTTSAINQYIASSADSIVQSNVSNLDSVRGTTYQNQPVIFQPFFDLRSITASSTSPPDQGQAYNTPTSDSTLQSFSTSPERTYPQLQHSQPVFTNPQQHQVQPQVKQHTQSSRPIHPPRSLLPRPGRSNQQGSIRQSSSQSKHISGQTRFSVQPQQPHATPSQSNPSASHHSSGPQQSVPWTNERHDTSAHPSAGRLYHVSATNVLSVPKKGQATGSHSTTQGSEPWNSKVRTKRKRSRKEGTQESSTVSDGDSDDEELAGGISVGMGGVGVVGKGDTSGRLPGACSHCKRLKMKCDFPQDENTCNRCKAGGHVCIVEGRRPRTAPNKREYLLAQIRQKDAIIESLLKQLHNPYIATPLSIASYRMATSPSDQTNNNVLAWLDRLQSSVREPGSSKITREFLEPQKPKDEDSDADSDGKRTLSQSDINLQSSGTGNDDHLADSDNETVQSALPDSTVPLGLIANLSLSNKKKVGKKKDSGKEAAGLLEAELNDDNIGVANETYFMPGPATDLGIRASLIEQHSPPEILIHGLVKPEDVDNLFQIFYERINPFISLLDPVLHTPASTFTRCPFLFTVICAICSRFYTEKSEIYPIAMHFAKHSAASALTDGWKSVELCQAYILMSIYAVPARRWEEDRSWLYTGLAIRIATDLNLHQISNAKPQSEKEEREILNRRRTWLICFNLDRSTATQFGKPSTIKEDYLVRNSREWYKKSKHSHPYDVHLCAYTALLRIVKKFHDEIFSDPSEPTGLNKNIDFKTVTLAYDAQLTAYHQEWTRRFQEDSDPRNTGCVFRCTLLPFLVAYSRLVMFSFGFQQAFRRGFRNNDPLFFNTCLDAAKTVVKTMINILAPSGYMRFAPDGHFVFASFASAFLLKLLQPEFSSFLTKEQETEILDLIGRLIQTLSSPKIAIDDRHTPKLYARFLAGLLSRHRRDGTGPGRSQANPPPRERVPASVPQAGPPPVTSVPLQTESENGQTGQQSQMPGNNTTQAMDTSTSFPHSSFDDIPFTLEDFDMTALDVISEAEMLATMQAIKNPAWWSTGLMPGFSWPEGSPSPRSDVSPSIPFQNANGNIPAPGLITPQWNIFQGTTVV